MFQKSLSVAVFSSLMMGLSPFLFAASEESSAANLIEEIVVTGSRRKVLSSSDTIAPVDTIDSVLLSAQGYSDMANVLRTVVPSFNVNTQAISDAASLIRPANLRGLAPDQTLVLVNGKRRHRGSVVVFLGGGGIADGSQGPDISAIPAIALQRVEVLRDGAAAQYGSDAIAGVMNFVLREDDSGGSIEVKTGETYAGDGQQLHIAGNLGMAVTDAGFLNFSTEWRQADPTVRSVQRDDALGLIADGNTAVRQPYTQIWGSPEVHKDWKIFFNFGLQTGPGQLYSFGNYSEREIELGFYYRNPNTRGGVNSNDDGRTRLVGDMAPFDGQTCPGAYNFNPGELSSGTIENPLIIGSAEEKNILAQIFADDNCFVFNEMFPGGFTPQFGGQLEDVSWATGYRGETDQGLSYDISAHVGSNQVDFFISNTVNPSLGFETPQAFSLGNYVQFEKNINADFSYPVDIDAFYSPLNIAAGFEWRNEQFEVGLGETSSYEIGTLAKLYSVEGRDANGHSVTHTFSQGFGIGSNGFAGFNEQVAGKWDRSNIAFYLDLEGDITEQLVLGTAIRWEDFSDFGATTNVKVSGLYKVTDSFKFRSSYSTGFRAPTVGQQQIINVTTAFDETDAGFQLVQIGTIPATNPVSVSKGALPLEPETSKSWTLGLASDIGSASLTLDYFNILVEDRITQSASTSLSNAERTALLDSGVTFAADLSTFRFFINDFDTRTQGIDLVLTLPLEIFSHSASSLSFAGNWTDTSVVAFNKATLNDVRIRQLTESLPEYRGNITFTQNSENWRFLLRMNYYGEYWEAHLDSADLPIDGGDEITVDVEFGYQLNTGLEMSIGAANLFDNYPDKSQWAGVDGALYPITSPMGFDGGSYYLKMKYNF